MLGLPDMQDIVTTVFTTETVSLPPFSPHHQPMLACLPPIHLNCLLEQLM